MTKNIGKKDCKSCGRKDCRGCGRKDCKKKGGLLDPGIDDGIYHFGDNFTIDIFADLEGNMPDEIEKLTNIDENKDRAIVFTGDLLDRGAKSIHNLKYMLNLKETYNDRVVLTCGNRDLNKIRCYREFSVDYIERIIGKTKNKGKEAWEIFKIIIDKYDMQDERKKGHFKFRFSAKQNEEYIALKGIWSKYGSEIIFVDAYSDDLEKRVNYIYSDTFGAPNQVDFFKEEFEELFKIYENYNKFRQREQKPGEYTDTKKQFYDKYIHLFIITMNIIMGVHWNGNIIPETFNDYNGLYIRYLQKCHIMSKITINDKLIIAAHSGIPYDVNNNRFIIPLSIGRDYSNLSIEKKKELIANLNERAAVVNNEIMVEDAAYYDFGVKYENGVGSGYIIPEPDNIGRNYPNINIENIAFLNKELTRFLNKFKTQIIKDEDPSFKEEFKKYIAMTAACLDECNRWKNDKTPEHSSTFSPIVSINSLSEKGPLKYKNIPIFLNRRFNEYKKIYNIFAHQPAGLLPSFSKVDNNGQTTYHINLDISKAEDSRGISNLKSYAYLSITHDSHKFIGKTIAKQKISLLTNVNGNDSEMTCSKEEEEIAIKIDNYEISLDDYGIIFKTYKIDDTKKYPIILHSTDDKTYYGMCSQNFQLLKYSKNTDEQQKQVGGISKKYKKSEKRFMNGKRKMVIYTGKRGAEYVKVKGVFISLAKYKKIISKDVKKIK
jgi:hypothetical protein